jgi:TolA-binding protein
VEGSDVEGGITFWYARSLFDLGRHGDALVSLDKFEERFPGDPYLTQVVRLRGRCYLGLGQRERALSIFSEFEKQYPGAAEAPENLLDLATLNEQDGRHDKAEAITRRIVKDYPASVAAQQGLLWLGNLAMDRNELSLAREMVTVLAEHEDAQPDLRASAWFALARIEDAQTNVAAAVDACIRGEGLARDASLKTRGRIQHSRLLVRLGHVDEAVELLADTVKSSSVEPGVGDAQLELAHLLLDQKKFTQALAAFQAYIEAISDPAGEARALLGKAWCLWELNRYAEAATTFEKAYVALSDPGARELALTKEADSHFANAQYKLAEEVYSRVRSEFPGSVQMPAIQYQQGECLARLSAWGPAEETFRSIVDAWPTNKIAERSLMRLAGMRESRGQWEEAIRVYDELMTSRPESDLMGPALLGRAMAQYRLARFGEARADYEKVCAVFPKTEWAEQAFYMQGWCDYLLGDAKKAVQICNQFLADFPDSKWVPDVVFWLAEYRFNVGSFEEAEATFIEVSTRFPQHALADDAIYWAGRAAAEQNEYRRANTYYNEMCKTYSNSARVAEARFAQGDALTELGEFAGAILAFDEIIKKVPSGDLVDRARGRKGDCQFTLGSDRPERYQEALASYRLVFESGTASPELKLQAEFKMGRCLEKMKRKPEAFEHYMNVVYGWLALRDAGNPPDSLWFTRAAFGAAALKDAEGDGEAAMRIYERVRDAGIPASRDAQKRIEKMTGANAPP